MKFKMLIFAALCLLGINNSMAQSSGYSKERLLEMNEIWQHKLNITLPLFINGNNIKDDVGANIAYSCIIAPFSPMLVARYTLFDSKMNLKNDRSGGFITNHSIKYIFMTLYGKSGMTDSIPSHFKDTLHHSYWPLSTIPESRFSFRNIDTTKLVDILHGKFVDANQWTIQITSSTDIPEAEVRRQMINAMEQQFGLKSFLEKQKRKCWVISRNGLPIPEYSNSLTQIILTNNKTPGRGYVQINDIPMERFAWLIHRKFQSTPYPIIDETGFKGHLGEIIFTTEEPLTLDNIAKHLTEFGMQMTLEDREVDVLVLTKANSRP